MPAISADTVALPRIPDPDPTAVHRPVVSVTTAPSGLEGEGFPVRRAFAGVDLAALDPFVHLDQMGEIDYAPGGPKGDPLAPPPRLRGPGRMKDTSGPSASSPTIPSCCCAGGPACPDPRPGCPHRPAPGS
jgi:hypothetical protein